MIVSVSSEKRRGFRRPRAGTQRVGCRCVEANISCPTRNSDRRQFRDARGSYQETGPAIREETNKPFWVKLSPNAGDIVSIAQAAEDAGADALVIANTFLSLKIRTDNFRPALGNKFGGLISPALKPIVLRMVYQVAKAVKIPIIGIGGVTKAEDVVESAGRRQRRRHRLCGVSQSDRADHDHRGPGEMVRHQESHRIDRRGARRRYGTRHSRCGVERRLTGRDSRCISV